MHVDGFESLTDEQKAKVCAAKTSEDILELAKEEGYELTDAQLEDISGGWASCPQDTNSGPY